MHPYIYFQPIFCLFSSFPLLKVIEEAWEENQAIVTVSQSWFLADGSEISSEEVKKWCIPVITCTSNGIQPSITFLREETATITVPLNGPEGWIKLNAGQDVPMRVAYTSSMLERIAIGIKTRTLSAADRAGLLGDAYALVKAGQMKPEDMIRLLSHYSGETDAVVWGAINSVLSGLNAIMSDDQAMNEFFRSFARKLLKSLTTLVSWEACPNDGHLTALLRATMVDLLSTFRYDDPDVALEASTRFKKFLEDPSDVMSLPSDLKTGVFGIYVKNGGVQEYEEILAYFDSATDNAERKHTLKSLGLTLNNNLKRRTLDWAISGKIKLQDFFYPMGSVGNSSKEGRQISWKFFQENFDKISGMVGKASPSLMDACIVSCCGTFCSEDMASEIEDFFNSHPLPRNARKISQTVENIRANAKFLKKLQHSDLSNVSFWDSLLLH
jgi:puromycin-sensitive aminopeptidase